MKFQYMQKKRKIWALAYGFGAACVDETIQCFVPDRGPGIKDVMIDTAGVAVGITLLLLGYTIYKKQKSKQKKNDIQSNLIIVLFLYIFF